MTLVVLTEEEARGLCKPHLRDTGKRVQSTDTVDGVEMCAACASDQAPDPIDGADASFTGRRFHKHARNCSWCRQVLTAEEGSEEASPAKLCHNGKKLWVEAVEAAQAEAKVS